VSNLRLVPPVGGPIDIAGERTLLGRDPGADLVVNDPSVSRRHALIERRPEGWVVVDQRSANGTFINNQRIEQAVLQSGHQLRLGAVSFEVRLPGAAAAPAPPAYAPPPVYAPPAPPAPAYVAPPAAPAAYPPQPAYAPPPPAAPPPVVGGPAAPAFVPLTPAAPKAPGPAPSAAPAAPGAMSPAEAAELIGLWPGSPPDEVRKRYQKLYNDFQIRLTNAPTPALKKMYQRNMQDLRTACEVISPGAIG
jgi:predicted component of type VI protein secretion system